MVEMDNFRIDSHKLIYHIPRVNEWLRGKNIYPIYIEIGLYGGCNHRCIFCAFDFLKYEPYILDGRRLRKFIREAAERGVKAILYSGEGEPLLYKNAIDIVIFTKQTGIDVALVTNGVMYDKERAKRSLGYLTWLKVSLDAGLEKTYGVIHGTKKDDFKIVLNNIKEAVKIRDRDKHNCSIGVQFLLIPQNYKEVIPLAQILSNLGVDYLVIKPYCRYPQGMSRIGAKFEYKNMFYLEKKLEKYSKNNFQIIFRKHTMEKLEKEKPYGYCLGLPFAAHVTAEGDMYPCNVFVGKKEFAFGNICQKSFKDIWQGKRRKEIMEMIYTKWNIRNCRKACRLDEINRYLWELRNPSSHVNFI